jgi:hypothetical protein
MTTPKPAEQQSGISISVDDILDLMSDGSSVRLITASVDANDINRLQLLVAEINHQLNKLAIIKGSRFVMEIRSPIDGEVTMEEIEALIGAVEKRLGGEGVWGSLILKNIEFFLVNVIFEELKLKLDNYGCF